MDRSAGGHLEAVVAILHHLAHRAGGNHSALRDERPRAQGYWAHALRDHARRQARGRGSPVRPVSLATFFPKRTRSKTMNLHAAAPASVDLATIKGRQQAAWASGDYAVIGTTLQIVGETLCEAVDLRSNQRVLDVAAGNGNATLAAARRFAEVVSTDYVGALLERGRERAAADRLPVTFQEADAEALPFADGSFDVVLSTFGVMFTTNQQQAANELMRVCRPGGKIGMANWTPEGFIGRLFKIIGKYVPPAPGVKSPALWGNKAHLDALFGAKAAVAAESKDYVF